MTRTLEPLFRDVFLPLYPEGPRTDLARVRAEDVQPEPHESIAIRLKLDSPHQAGNLLTTAKRMFTRIFKSVVARYAADEKETRDEVSELWRIFSSSAAK